ncbi:MAG: malectin domain-containing carbohydrate-binding protein, partial [Mobilicoccus sp.]|nr:malectin domain-containing carbohydrate-binding protein [Mobilicoccus sp.]
MPLRFSRRPASVLMTVALALSATATAVVHAGGTAEAAGDTFRMTVAPNAFTASDGTRWEARTGFVGGDFHQSYGSSARIAGASDSRLYHPELVRFSSWSAPVSNGTYRVTLKMREQWWDNPGQRVFSVKAEGNTVLSDIDIVKAVGKNTAYDRTFEVAVNDGRLNLEFPATKDSALVSAMEITRVADAKATSNVVHRQGAGYSDVRDSAGNVYRRAEGFTGNGVRSETAESTIRGTSDQAVYREARVFMDRWSTAVPNGTYDVTLKMREQYWDRAGQRVFDVLAEGRTALSRVDIVQAVGKNTAYDRTFRTEVKDGRLDLQWRAIADTGTVSGIVVNRVDG